MTFVYICLFLIWGVTLTIGALISWPFVKLTTMIFGLRVHWMDALSAAATSWMILGVFGGIANALIQHFKEVLPDTSENQLGIAFVSLMTVIGLIIFAVKSYNDILETSNGFFILLIERLMTIVFFAPFALMGFFGGEGIKEWHRTSEQVLAEQRAAEERTLALQREEIRRNTNYVDNPFKPDTPSVLPGDPNDPNDPSNPTATLDPLFDATGTTIPGNLPMEIIDGSDSATPPAGASRRMRIRVHFANAVVTQGGANVFQPGNFYLADLVRQQLGPFATQISCDPTNIGLPYYDDDVAGLQRDLDGYQGFFTVDFYPGQTAVASTNPVGLPANGNPAGTPNAATSTGPIATGPAFTSTDSVDPDKGYLQRFHVQVSLTPQQVARFTGDIRSPSNSAVQTAIMGSGVFPQVNGLGGDNETISLPNYADELSRFQLDNARNFYGGLTVEFYSAPNSIQHLGSYPRSNFFGTNIPIPDAPTTSGSDAFMQEAQRQYEAGNYRVGRQFLAAAALADENNSVWDEIGFCEQIGQVVLGMRWEVCLIDPAATGQRLSDSEFANLTGTLGGTLRKGLEDQMAAQLTSVSVRQPVDVYTYPSVAQYARSALYRFDHDCAVLLVLDAQTKGLEAQICNLVDGKILWKHRPITVDEIAQAAQQGQALDVEYASEVLQETAKYNIERSAPLTRSIVGAQGIPYVGGSLQAVEKYMRFQFLYRAGIYNPRELHRNMINADPRMAAHLFSVNPSQRLLALEVALGVVKP